MLLGCYYRCPVPIEAGDEDHPRFFVLAQAVGYDELSDLVRVKMHDLLGSFQYYSEILAHTAFYAPTLARCAAMPGGAVRSSRWGPGTVLTRVEPSSDDAPYWYIIRLESGRYVKVCETELQIEYSQMDFDPEQQLLHYEFQNPTWFINRLKVSRNVQLVNHAAYGFRVLAGCRAFLLPHQISTVARCFETLPIRYMLADEVGLGKTVEACSILKILASETAGFRALLIVPGALLSQWKNELHYKYALQATSYLLESDLSILPLEELDTLKAKRILRADWDLLIVDETHRLLAEERWYAEIQALSRRITHVLLLSATPIQDRKEEYRLLLALLHPEQYADMPAERFAFLVQKQKQVQRSANQQLKRLERFDEYGELIADKLRSMADTLGDRALTGLVDAVDLSAEDGGKEAATQALAYICENYRVERRVIRNRRQLLSQKMARRRLLALPYTPATADEAYNETGAIQNTLSYLTEHCDGRREYVTQVAIPLLGALFSSPWAFEDALRALSIEDGVLCSSAQTWKKQAEREHAMVDQILDEDPDLIRGRLMTAMNYLDQETDILSDPECKIVVFTGYNATLTEFQRMFNARYRPQGVYAAAFGRHMSRRELEDSVYAFQNDGACRVIVCDETGGEGRNFQNAEQIIHLDLPWNANALEQRIGRLDRLGRDPGLDVLSVVIYAQHSVEEQLFRIWRDGMKLFEQSLSGLEIITGELHALLVDAVLDDVRNGLERAFEDILEQAEEMRESVEDEQLFDIGATLYQPLSQGVNHILELYAQEADNLFAQAMLGWGKQAGLEAERPGPDGLVEFRESRFSPNAARQSLFVPPNWLVYRDASILRREGSILGSFDRRTAALREDVLFFAPGDGVYDAIISNAVGCSRGRCTAIGTTGPFRYDGLVYFYRIEVPVDTLIEEGAGLQALAQFRMFLPLEQIVVPLGLMKESRKVPAEEIVSLLGNLKESWAEHLGRRGAGRGSVSPLERFMLHFPPEDWEPLVREYTKEAYRRAVKQLWEKADLATARQEMRRILNGERAEALYFGRSLDAVEEKRAVFRAAMAAMERARPVLDSVCYLGVRRHG